MHFKKTMCLATLLSLSCTAYAGLQTFNYTDEDSSVKVTSGILKPCSGSVGVYTPKKHADGSPGVSAAKDNEITLLCKTSKDNVCTADIYNSNNCSGTRVGYASLNLSTKSVISVTSTNDKYVFVSEDGGTVLKVKYA
jgi:hypothetical protein